MTHDGDPEFTENWRVLDDVIEFTHELVAHRASEELDYLVRGRIGVYSVTPNNPRASWISVIAEQWLIVTVGGFGGRWELDYTDEHHHLARQLIAATVAGRVEERRALGRSCVSVALDNGGVERAIGYEGCAPLLVPQPGWRIWGRRKVFEPY